jgi:2-dehydro-3-deoxygluconokinase
MSTISPWHDVRCIAALGEPLLELQPNDTGGFGVSFGGDVANVMVCLARLLERGQFELRLATSLGSSLYSEWLRTQLLRVGLLLSEATIPGEPGIYGISPDPARQPASSYWRECSCARQLLRRITGEELAQLIPRVDLLIVTGVTIALCSDGSFEALCEWIEGLGARPNIVFDSNYRPTLWTSLEQARQRMRRMEALAGTVVTSLEDEQLLWQNENIATVMERFRSGGQEVVMRAGKEGCWIGQAGNWDHVPAQSVTVVDTVGAGDSHQAAYVAARLCERSRFDAAVFANRVAGALVGQRGSVLSADTVIPSLSLA